MEIDRKILEQTAILISIVNSPRYSLDNLVNSRRNNVWNRETISILIGFAPMLTLALTGAAGLNVMPVVNEWINIKLNSAESFNLEITIVASLLIWTIAWFLIGSKSWRNKCRAWDAEAEAERIELIKADVARCDLNLDKLKSALKQKNSEIAPVLEWINQISDALAKVSK